MATPLIIHKSEKTPIMSEQDPILMKNYDHIKQRRTSLENIKSLGDTYIGSGSTSSTSTWQTLPGDNDSDDGPNVDD